MDTINKQDAIDLFEKIWSGTVTTEYFNRELWKKHSYMYVLPTTGILLAMFNNITVRIFGHIGR